MQTHSNDENCFLAENETHYLEIYSIFSVIVKRLLENSLNIEFKVI